MNTAKSSEPDGQRSIIANNVVAELYNKLNGSKYRNLIFAPLTEDALVALKASFDKEFSSIKELSPYSPGFTSIEYDELTREIHISCNTEAPDWFKNEFNRFTTKHQALQQSNKTL